MIAKCFSVSTLASKLTSLSNSAKRRTLAPVYRSQARNQLGTPVGGEEFSERGPKSFNYVQHIFPGGVKKISSPPLLRCYRPDPS